MLNPLQALISASLMSLRYFLSAVCFLTLSSHCIGNAMAQELSDPLESVNRRIFWFNDQVDIYLLEPVAEGYDYVVPNPVQHSVTNFFNNLKFPVFLVSSLVQLKFDQALEHSGRFLLNTTLGIAGLFDVAAEFGLEHHYEDFGVALGYHGVPPGPFIVLPLLGPSNVRDGLGKIVDMFLNPTYHVGYLELSDDEELAIIIGTSALDIVNTRASLLHAIKSGKEASLDYYTFVQSSYYQVRQNHIYDGNPPETEAEDSYEETRETP